LLADPAHRSRRLAFVVSPTLVRSQLMRALASRDSRCFGEVAEAEAWLFAKDEETQAERAPSRLRLMGWKPASSIGMPVGRARRGGPTPAGRARSLGAPIKVPL
jgi:hypothetical protein